MFNHPKYKNKKNKNEASFTIRGVDAKVADEKEKLLEKLKSYSIISPAKPQRTT